jgi:urease accessory protein UreH
VSQVTRIGSLVEIVATGLRHDGEAFSDPMAALDVLIDAQTAELLITRVEFAPRKPNGIAPSRTAEAVEMRSSAYSEDASGR